MLSLRNFDSAKTAFKRKKQKFHSLFLKRKHRITFWDSAISNGVLSSICPEKLSKNGGNVNLTTKWAQEILKSINWVKRRGTTAKREMNSPLHEALTFTRKRKNANSLFEHGIHNEMSLNFDQTPLAFAGPFYTSKSKMALSKRTSSL